MTYHVTLNTGVWTFQEKDALVAYSPGSKIKFWGCSQADSTFLSSRYLMENGILGEGSQILTNGTKENSAFSLMIG